MHPHKDQHSDIALELLSNARRLPLSYSILHLVAGLAFLVLVLSVGQEIPITFGAVITLCSAGALQMILFSYIYFKSSPTPSATLQDISTKLLNMRPFLIVGLTVPFLIVVFFIVASIVAGVNITRKASDSHPINLLPEYYTIGMGVAMVVFEIFPILVHHDLLIKIRLITNSLSALLFAETRPECPPSIIGNSNGMERLTVNEFLVEQHFAACDFEPRTLLRPPPPPYIV